MGYVWTMDSRYLGGRTHPKAAINLGIVALAREDTETPTEKSWHRWIGNLWEVMCSFFQCQTFSPFAIHGAAISMERWDSERCDNGADNIFLRNISNVGKNDHGGESTGR